MIIIVMSRTNLGQAAIYNGGLQQGLGIGRALKSISGAAQKVSDFAKEHKLVTKADKIISAIPGARQYLDANTGGLASKALREGRYAGYGRRRRRKSGGCGKRKRGGCHKR